MGLYCFHDCRADSLPSRVLVYRHICYIALVRNRLHTAVTHGFAVFHRLEQGVPVIAAQSGFQVGIAPRRAQILVFQQRHVVEVRQTAPYYFHAAVLSACESRTYIASAF